MVEIRIEKDDAGQRLDRFLKKYFKKAALSRIYKMIRKDIKVDGKRVKENAMLMEGNVLSIYISEDEFSSLREEKKRINVTKQFRIVYEDEDIIIVSKPFGLLTHGDSREKRNHLTNQVINYLISTGEYAPKASSTFAPSPVNRLDRNTTGLVIFGKNAQALKELNKMIKSRDNIGKYYLTIVAGEMKEPLELKGSLLKDEKKNMVMVSDGEVCVQDGNKSDIKEIQTIARPLKAAKGFTLTEVELVTGRTHQIRAHLAHGGFPVIGDAKYGDNKINQRMKEKYGLSTQLLHAYKLIINGTVIKDRLPYQFDMIAGDLFGAIAGE